MDCDQQSIQPCRPGGRSSNPFPFLLWIATLISSKLHADTNTVVTLFHFYCGLRLTVEIRAIKHVHLVVTLFHFYCGLRQLQPIQQRRTTLRVVTLFHFYCGLRRNYL